MKKTISLAVLLALSLNSCAVHPEVPATVAPSAQTVLAGASILQYLPNAEYPIEIAATGKAQLKDGAFEEPAAPGSAAMTKIWLGEVQGFGDINGDGLEDIATTLIADPGGSGTFTFLTLVLNDKGAAKPVASVYLGDRILVESLVIEAESVIVIMLDRKPDDPMSAEPTVEVTRIFKLEGDPLTEIK